MIREAFTEVTFKERYERWEGKNPPGTGNSKPKCPQAGVLTDFFKEHQGGQCDWSNVNKGSSSRRPDKRGDKGPEHIDSCFYF